MPKSWKETIATDQYKAGTTEQKQEWKNKYFNEVCAPEFDKGQVAQKRKEFYAYADKLEPKQPKWTQDVSDIYMSGFTGKSMTPPKPPTPVPDWKAKYGEFYKESPEWQQHPKGGGGRIETPFIDPVVDPIMGGVFGLKHGLKAGLKGAELIKNVAREAWSDFTFGGSDIAGGLTKKALRKFSGKKVEKFVPVTGTDEIGMKVADMFKETDKAAKDLYKVKRAEKFRSRWVDVSGNIKKKLNAFGEPGKEVVMKHDLTLGSSAKANEIVNDAFDRIYKGLNSNQERILNNIIQSNRTSGIGKYKTGVSSPKGFDGIDNKIYYDGVDKFERIPLQEAEMLKQRAAEYHNIYRESLREQYRNGILTQENIEALMEKGDYSPRRYIHHIDPDGTFGYGGKKIEAKNTGIKSLESGSEELLEKNSRLLLADSINLHQALIFKNKANQSLYKFARELPDNGFVKIHKGEAPSGYDPLNVFFKGNKTQLIMKSDIAKGWVKNDPVINSAAARAMEWASGTKILKAMATGYNPEFAITNFPRDLAHIWMTTTEYSPHLLPSISKGKGFRGGAVAQLAKDLSVTAKDAFTRKGAYKDFINEGGGMHFLSTQGRFKNPKLKALGDYLGYVGETSEIWTRLALRNRAKVNGHSAEYATWKARDYLDFQQGGSFAKALDKGVPYLNAAVQATRGIGRAAKESPGTFTYKLGQLATLSWGLYLANRQTNPDALKEISPREKNNNFIITTPLSYEGKDKIRRHHYVTVAKDQTQRLWSTIFEGLAAKTMGDEYDWDRIKEAAMDLVPIIPTDLMPPVLDAIIGYKGNLDIWRNQKIWKGKKSLPEDEFTPRTHPALVQAGQLTGMSPDKMAYALEQIFTKGNIYTSLAGAGLRGIYNELPQSERDDASSRIISRLPFARRVFKTTYPDQKARKLSDERERIRNSQILRQYRKVDPYGKAHFRGDTSAKNKFKDYLKTQPKPDRQKLINRFEFGKYADIPHRNLMFDLKFSNAPEDRAHILYEKGKGRSEEFKKSLLKSADRIGVLSERTRAEYNKLRKK